jgi:hypothetical protein
MMPSHLTSAQTKAGIIGAGPWTRRAARALAALALCSRIAAAHPIHTTLTVITPEAAGRVLRFNIRAFADDFSATVAKFAGRPAPADSSAVPAEVIRYIRARFTVTGAHGESLALEPCGITRARELYWLCFRVTLPPGAGGTKVGNQMLTELHPDQVNIVQLESGSARKSYLFTRGSALSALP